MEKNSRSKRKNLKPGPERHKTIDNDMILRKTGMKKEP
jgi:hypothetical protein